MRKPTILAACLVLTGCAFSHNSHLSERGTLVSAQQMTQIVPGTTDKRWVLENIGTPDRVHADSDGLEIYEYVARTTQHVDSDFILLFSWETERIVETVVTRIVMKGGIVASFEMTQS